MIFKEQYLKTRSENDRIGCLLLTCASYLFIFIHFSNTSDVATYRPEALKLGRIAKFDVLFLVKESDGLIVMTVIGWLASTL